MYFHSLLFGFCPWCYTSIIRFFAVFRWVWDISPRFASQFAKLARILYRRILAMHRELSSMVSFTQQNITNISPKFCLKTAKYRGHLAEKSFSGDVKYRRNVGDISRGQSSEFRLHCFCTVLYAYTLPSPALLLLR